MVYQDGETGKAFAKKFQIGGLSRDKLYPLVKSENSRIVYLHISADGKRDAQDAPRLARRPQRRARARTRFRSHRASPSARRTSKGLTVTKWSVKDVKKIE